VPSPPPSSPSREALTWPSYLVHEVSMSHSSPPPSPSPFLPLPFNRLCLQIVAWCVLSGCDYLPSLPGIAVKMAHGIVERCRIQGTGTADALVRGLMIDGSDIGDARMSSCWSCDCALSSLSLSFCPPPLTCPHHWLFPLLPLAMPNMPPPSYTSQTTAILRRLRVEAKFPVPPEFEAGFRRALLTFRHQTVFDPRARRMVPLLPLEVLDPAVDLSFLGPVVSETCHALFLPLSHPPSVAPRVCGALAGVGSVNSFDFLVCGSPCVCVLLVLPLTCSVSVRIHVGCARLQLPDDLAQAIADGVVNPHDHSVFTAPLLTTPGSASVPVLRRNTTGGLPGGASKPGPRGGAGGAGAGGAGMCHIFCVEGVDV
jgi:hypothetical protein